MTSFDPPLGGMHAGGDDAEAEGGDEDSDDNEEQLPDLVGTVSACTVSLGNVHEGLRSLP